MPQISHIIMPREETIRYAHRTDPRTAADIAYAAKAVLGECFGDGAVRPFRVIDENENLQVVGISMNKLPEPAQTGKDLTASISSVEWKAEKGKEIWLDILCCPMESSYGEEKSVAHSRGRKVTGQKEAFVQWLLQKIGADNTGCSAAGIPQFISIETVPVIRKDHKGNPVTFVVPSVHVMLKVAIADPVMFESFLSTGIGRQRGLGFGTMLPREVLNELGL